MSRRFASRPRHQLKRISPKFPARNRQEYLRQHWTYRHQQTFYQKHPLGFGLSLVPYGWQMVRGMTRRRA